MKILLEADKYSTTLPSPGGRPFFHPSITPFSQAGCVSAQSAHRDFASLDEGATNDYDAAELADPDHDGAPTRDEYPAGTDPLDGNSLFAILDMDTHSGTNRIVWYGTTNWGVATPFSVDRADVLTGQVWTCVASNLVRHPTGTNSWVDPEPPLPTPAFYRVHILPDI